jgi:hypothetical protein
MQPVAPRTQPKGVIGTKSTENLLQRREKQRMSVEVFDLHLRVCLAIAQWINKAKMSFEKIPRITNPGIAYWNNSHELHKTHTNQILFCRHNIFVY